MNNRYLDGLALGLTLGFISSTALFWALDETTGLVQKYLPEQITHIVTLTAAALALVGISRQIQSNVELTEKNRLAKLDAAKSTLPLVLSNIYDLCRQRYYSVAYGRREPAENARWEMTDFEISTLKDCIEHSIGFEKELMQQIIRVYQVLVVRWDTIEMENLFESEELGEHDAVKLGSLRQFAAIADWASLEAIVTSLFKFSRVTC